MAAAKPLFSILLPAFDAGATLGACLRSIERQREGRWECLLVDDGSRDDTRRIAQTFAKRDGRFRVLSASPDEKHVGLIAALTRGLTACAAPWVARMDADDVMHRDRLAAQRSALEAAPQLSGVGCHVRLFPRDALTAGRRAYERWLNSIDSPERVRQDSFVECPIAHPTLVIRRELLQELGYRDAAWAEDYDLVLRLLAAGHRLGVVPRRLLLWRDGPGRLSRTADRYRLERFTECKAAFLSEGLLASSDDYVLWGYGSTGRSLRTALLRHGKRPELIVELHPGRLGQRIHGAPVIPPADLQSIRELPILVSVAGPTARHQIREALRSMGFDELTDYVCCA